MKLLELKTNSQHKLKAFYKASLNFSTFWQQEIFKLNKCKQWSLGLEAYKLFSKKWAYKPSYEFRTTLDTKLSFFKAF